MKFSCFQGCLMCEKFWIDLISNVYGNRYFNKFKKTILVLLTSPIKIHSLPSNHNVNQ